IRDICNFLSTLIHTKAIATRLREDQEHHARYCEQAGLLTLQNPRSPQVEACPIILSALELFAFQFIDRNFAGEQSCTFHEMAAEDFSLRVAQSDVGVDERLPVPHADIPAQAEDLHTPFTFDRIIGLRLLIVVGKNSVHGGADSLNTPEADVLRLDELRQSVEQIGTMGELTDYGSDGAVLRHQCSEAR